MESFLKDLPVFILVGAFLGFFAYIFIKSRKQDQEEKNQKRK
jgi:H+/Cl- antiporter ClcA